mmetsp:Transcript_10172/g.24419  ORF Transcript_10172/g.24419 Transcript_10172/m.24419 type:complete len:211 (-) Transcript_10172:485-1117(-)
MCSVRPSWKPAMASYIHGCRAPSNQAGKDVMLISGSVLALLRSNSSTHTEHSAAHASWSAVACSHVVLIPCVVRRVEKYTASTLGCSAFLLRSTAAIAVLKFLSAARCRTVRLSGVSTGPVTSQAGSIASKTSSSSAKLNRDGDDPSGNMLKLDRERHSFGEKGRKKRGPFLRMHADKPKNACRASQVAVPCSASSADAPILLAHIFSTR